MDLRSVKKDVSGENRVGAFLMLEDEIETDVLKKLNKGRACREETKTIAKVRHLTERRINLRFLITTLLANYLSLYLLSVSSQQMNANMTHSIQLFLPPVVVPSISLAGGYQAKKVPEEEKDGFVMKAPLLVSSNESLSELDANQYTDNTEQTTTVSSDDPFNQRIPIDVNRQQFVTHDQLSMLNASTKDENIYLSSGAIEDPIQRVQTSRSGMSKVSHVSSLLSDIFAYATRARFGGEEQQVVQRTGSPTTTTSASTTTTASISNRAQHVTCPGICRNFITAPILCRNEISAPCPSVLQRCCEKDDVSFNGTPVETSAPLSNQDPDPNAAQMSENLPQTQDQTLFDSQPTQPTNPPSSSQTTPQPAPEISRKSVGDTANAKPNDHKPTSTVELVNPEPFNSQPSIYFLSSSNGSSSSGINYAEPSSRTQVHGELAQPVVADEQTRFKHTASQSFDSPLISDKSSQVSVSKRLDSTQQQVVVVHTANGTILHQPGRRQPNYANRTDYLLMRQMKPNQPVNYHSNIDPVKRFVEANATSNRQAEDTQMAASQRHSILADKEEPEGQLKVLNDQHSGSTKAQKPIEPKTATTTTSTPKPSTADPVDRQAQGIAGSVGNVLVDLLESYFGTSTGNAGETRGGSPTVDQEVSGDQRYPPGLASEGSSSEASAESQDQHQTNDRRLGYDLSFRQQSSEQNASGIDPSVGQDVGGLMTSDGASESVADTGSGKCPGICILPLFAVVCDSSYKSDFCGPTLKCCVNSRPTSNDDQANQQLADQQLEQVVSNNRQPQAQQVSACRGSCLPVYHSSLCTKPNEIQLDSTGCLANHVCCTQPTLIESSSNHIEELDSAHESLIKDNSLFAALMPPPPPAISQIEEKSNFNDQLMAASQHQKQLAILSPQENFQVYPATTARPSSAKTSQSGGIMSQLYQMFKSSGSSSKQRQRLPQQQQQTHHHQPQQMAPQMFEAYHQMQASNLRPQLMYPQQALMLGRYPTSYQAEAMDMKQSVRNRFNAMDQQQFVQQQQQQQPVAQTVQKFNSQPAMQQPKINYQQMTPVSLLPFKESNDKFAPMPNQISMTNPNPNSNPNANQNLNPEPTMLSFNPPTGIQQTNYVKQTGGFAYQSNGRQQFNSDNAFAVPFQQNNNNKSQQPQFAPKQSQFPYQQSTGGKQSNRLETTSRPLIGMSANQVNRQLYVDQQRRPSLAPNRAVGQQNALRQVVPEVDNGGRLAVNQAAKVGQQPQVKAAPNRPLAPKVGLKAVTNQMQDNSALSSSSSNLNVMISSGPFVDLQRVENDSLRVIPKTSDELSSDFRPDKVSSCPSACSAPSSCLKPNYVDESLACAVQGSVCCIIKASKDPQPSESNKLDAIAADQELDPTEDQADKQEDVQETSLSEDRNKNRATSCGLHGTSRRTSGQAKGRVMGGFDAKPGHWCWQAALMNNKNEYLCGGALIGTKWVLTAAHCVTQHLRNENQLYVRLGQHNLNNTQANAKTILVKTSYVHHNHNGQTLDNDIALLRLEESVDLEDPAICLVCLPNRSSQLEPGKRCTVTGYGYENEEGPAALRIRQTDLPIVADQECQRKTSDVLKKPFTLPASSFCAGGELGQDACHGDGGSPLSCLVDGYYELTGIVSWGYKCGSKDLPGLYSKVSTFVGWINQIVSASITNF